MIAREIERIIKKVVYDVLNKSKEGKEIPLPVDFIETDTIGEVIEKLAILHCRMWHIEDTMMENYDNDQILADLKRKTDICFKVKRPRYVEAINRLIDLAIRENKNLAEDSVKLYKGFK